MVRKSTIHRNPIGSTSEALQRQRSRQSLRRRIMEVSSADLACSTEGLLEFNPALAEVSHTTRIAYAKFMTSKLKKEIKFEDEKVTMENEKIRARETKAFNKFKMNAGILKKSLKEKSNVESNNQKDLSQKTETTTSLEENLKPKDFRARTPIEEDPNEDNQTPDRPLTPENVLDASNETSSALPSAKEDVCKADSPIVRVESSTVIEPPQMKTPDPTVEEQTDDSVESSAENIANKSQKKELTPPVASSSRANSPIPNLGTGDKGKSKITGKTLTGWI